MDFHLDDRQLALQDGIAAFCRDRWPLETIGERECAKLDRAGWRDLVELGVTSLLVSETRGGLSLGVVEGVVVFEQLGYHLVPGPCLWSALGAVVVPEIGAGELLAAGVEDGGQSPLIIEHAAEADILIALRPHGVSRIERDDVEPTTVGEGLDPQSRVGVFPSLPAGTTVGDAADTTRLRQLGTVLTAALQLGVANAALDVAVKYSLEREQFGVPIGSFQALKHMMADMYVRVGLARSATYAAAAVLDDSGVGNIDRSIRGAKLLAGEAAVQNARASVQVLGGMGFTWDMAPNFLLKRALVLDQTFGTPTAHALAIGSGLAEEVA